jgi:hypothetical protein
MKTPVIGLLNSIGFTNSAEKALYAASLLKAATVSSPSVVITPAVPPVLAKPAIAHVPAYPVRAASAAYVTTVAISAGALFAGSPAFAAGANIPAFPAKPATAEVLAVAAVAAVPGIPAVMSPTINALPGWSEAVSIVPSPTSVGIVAYLPCASSPHLIGASTDGISSIKELTAPQLDSTVWLDAKASAIPETATAGSEPLTLEQYFYKYSKAFIIANPTLGTIENTTKLINNVVVAVKKVTLNLPATGYDANSESLQLNKLATVSQGS